jgi:hypothetical protein
MLCKIKVGKLLVNGKRSRRVVMVGLDAAGTKCGSRDQVTAC